MDSMVTSINEDRWQSLTANQQNLLVECLKESGDFYSNSNGDVLARNKKLMEDAGCTFYPISDEDWDTLAKTINDLRDQMEAAGIYPPGLNQRIRDIVAGRTR
jgi:TRAP-type C4-dicarboxylate transport system substrate-binding protein